MNDKCGKKALISDYIDNLLPEKKKREFETHLEKCASCAQALSETKAAVEKVKAMKEMELPVNFYAKLNMKLDEAEIKKHGYIAAEPAAMMLKEDRQQDFESAENAPPGQKFNFRRFFGRGALVFASVFTVLIAYNVIKEDEKNRSILVEAPAAEKEEAAPAPADESTDSDRVMGLAADKAAAETKPAPVQPEKPKLKKYAEEEKPRSFAVTEQSAAAPEAEIAAENKFMFDLGMTGGAAMDAAPAPAVKSETRAKSAAPKAAAAPAEYYGMTGGAAAEQAAAVNTRPEWDSLPQSAALKNINPDFNAYTALVVFAGEKPTAGYNVRFVSVKEGVDAVTVEYIVSVPEEGAMTAQVITSPYAVKLISKTTKKINFIKR